MTIEVRLSDETVERVSEAVCGKAMQHAEQILQCHLEIGRLQRWLGYIAGGFAPPSESAEQALRGAPPPDGF